MKVKIGDKWYDSKDEPICLQVSKGEQEQIGNLDRSKAPSGKYAVFPDESNWTPDSMHKWMRG